MIILLLYNNKELQYYIYIYIYLAKKDYYNFLNPNSTFQNKELYLIHTFIEAS